MIYQKTSKMNLCVVTKASISNFILKEKKSDISRADKTIATCGCVKIKRKKFSFHT